MAAPGHDLIQADYSGIEGAVIAWSSGEHWKVRAMHEIIADPSLPDMYRRTAAGILNLPVETVTKKHWARQAVGKVSELALGFGGGVSAFHSMSKNYGVKLDPLFGPVWATADAERRERAVKRYESNVKRGKEKADELSREAWLACEIIKVGWRETNPAIKKGWHAREDAVRDAIRNPGTQFTALKCSYLVARGFLWCRLPSGRCLAYGAPKLRDQVWAEVLLDDGTWCDAEVMDREAAERMAVKGRCRINGATSPSISALSVNSVTKKWTRSHLYGGLLAENDTQAIARDLLVNGMRKAEAAGYPIIAHVYDEMIAEVPRGAGDLAAFEKLICELPEWAAGLPLTAGGWRGKR
jgi:DNA polymerase